MDLEFWPDFGERNPNTTAAQAGQSPKSLILSSPSVLHPMACGNICMLWTNPVLWRTAPSSQPWLRACPLPGRISYQWHGDVLQLTLPAFRTTSTTGPSTHTGSSQHHRPALHNHTSPPHSPRTFHQNITKRFTSTNELNPSTSQLTPGAEKQAEVSPSPCKPAEEPGMADRPASSLPLLSYRLVRYFKGSFQNRGKG